MKKSLTTLGATTALAAAALLGAAPAAQAEEIVLSNDIISTLYEYYGVVR